jgi:hypothetical protein
MQHLKGKSIEMSHLFWWLFCLLQKDVLEEGNLLATVTPELVTF